VLDIYDNFSPGERVLFGHRLEDEDWGKIYRPLMEELDRMTSFIKQVYRERNPKCVLHCITSGDHTTDSQHYLGRAVDCRFTSLSLYESVMMALLYGFTGVGFYPYSTPCFVHLDRKDIGEDRRRIWYRDERGNYIDARDLPEVFSKLRGPHRTCFLNGAD